jgi:hypothetical protein
MEVFTKLNRKLAKWSIDTDDPKEAIKMVRDDVVASHKDTILAVIRGGKKDFDASKKEAS